MKWSGNDNKLEFSVSAIGSDSYGAVSRRALRQLAECMLFENVLVHSRREIENGGVDFIISGLDSHELPVEYHCTGYISDSYGRVRLTGEILRHAKGGSR